MVSCRVETYNEYGSPLFQKAKQKHSRAEFLSRSAKKEPRKSYWNSPKISSDSSDSPIKGEKTCLSIQYPTSYILCSF